MARALTAALVTEKNKLHSTTPFIWLFELVVSDTVMARITSYQTNVTFNGNLFYAFPCTIGPIESNSESRVDSLQLIVANISREIQGILDGTDGSGDGLTRKRVFARLVHSAHLADPASGLLFDYRIITATATWETVTFTLGSYDLWGKESPKRRFVRAHCGWTYKSNDCGYVGDLATCDKTLSGPMGCKIHGDDEVAHSLPRLHPKRAGMFPGIPGSRT